MTPLPNNHYAIEVPEDKKFTPPQYTFSNFLPHSKEIVDSICWIRPSGLSLVQRIPPGSWEIISLASEISEEQAGGIVNEELRPDFDKGGELVLAGYENYTDNGIFDTPTASFRSLLTSLGLEKEYLIIVKK
jgi:hypothetical protein